MKKREEKWKRKTFSISEAAIEKLKEGCNYRDMNESAYIEFLIIQEAEQLNPIEKLNSIHKEILTKRKELETLEEKHSKIANEFSLYTNWLEEKRKNKPNAINNITRMILENRQVEAEKIAKYWEKRIGISAVQLIAESLQNIKKGI